MRILIIGGDSSIGKALHAYLQKAGHEVLRTTRCQGAAGIQLDLENTSSLSNIPPGPGKAIFLAGHSLLQACEKNPILSYAVNVTNTTLVARYLIEHGYSIAFLSTNMVFDGTKPYPLPSDIPNPKTVYGQQKYVVEQRLLQADAKTLIIRLTKVVHENIALFRNWMQHLAQGQSIEPFSNMYISPILLDDVVKKIVELIFQGHSGIHHISGKTQCSYAAWAQMLASHFGYSHLLIKPIHTNMELRFRPEYVTLGGGASSCIQTICQEFYHSIKEC